VREKKTPAKLGNARTFNYRRQQMNTSTIAWHRTSDRMPDDSILVIAADSDGDTFAAFFEDATWRYADAFPAPVPQFWAHFPTGPEA
jgi:hypothetical protein